MRANAVVPIPHHHYLSTVLVSTSPFLCEDFQWSSIVEGMVVLVHMLLNTFLRLT